MKGKHLIIAIIAATAIAGACGGRNTNTNTNTNVAAIATPAPTATLAANTDPGMKTSIDSELKKKGFTGVTVDVTTTPATLRGTYPKGRLQELIQTAQQANGGKPVKNEATEAK